MSSEQELSKGEIGQLIWHYQNILADTNLLVQTAIQRKVSVEVAYTQIKKQVAKLTKKFGDFDNDSGSE